MRGQVPTRGSVRNNGIVAREPLGPARWSCIYMVFAPYLTLSSIRIVQKQLAKMMNKHGVLPHHPTLFSIHTLFLLFILKLAI
jgi:hypothetical protein